MALGLGRVAWCAVLLSALAALGAGCTGAASRSPSASATVSRLSEATAKEALLVRFGPLVYCDPDYYPVARADEAGAAIEHLAEMQADAAAWAAISDHLGFDPSSTPAGDQLLAVYREWKMLRALALTSAGDGWSFDARFGATGPNASASPSIVHASGTIGADGMIHVDTDKPSDPPPCPICLARGTRIATPGGEVAVEAIRPGDPVWTLDRRGRMVQATVVSVGSMPVLTGHVVVRLVLVDGRTVLVSPGHPLPDGRPVATLREGDAYDGSVVASAERIPYDGRLTFDILPSGETGLYWANGIQLGSTLSR